ncbi:MAG: hypothetical protein KA327_06220 [Pseudarcicella sp.]|nr:hypothetical protein [Pseudarcicella sp.]
MKYFNPFFALHKTFCWIAFCLLFTGEGIWAQKPVGKFLIDTFNIGMPIKYTLSYRHKPSLDVFFPDSTYDFTPFEVISYDFIPTSTNQLGSLDSVTYTLVSFRDDAKQGLRLPVFVRSETDCTQVFTNTKYVFLRKNVPLSDKLSLSNLKHKNNLDAIDPQANYPLIAILSFCFILLALLINNFFGDAILRQISLFRFKRRFDDFNKNFQKLSATLEGERDSVLLNIERAVILWKKYIERIENKPFTTFTTKEILDNLKDERLNDALKEIDSTIYGGLVSSKTKVSLEILNNLARGLYIEKRKQFLSQKNVIHFEQSPEFIQVNQ